MLLKIVDTVILIVALGLLILAPSMKMIVEELQAKGKE